jgi:dTDP-3-amino-3,4,6-trideoxy-alpha-D-glucose transaminase
MAATSFYPTKNLGAIGDGGAILTSNPQYARQAAMYRDYGQSAKYRHSVLGCNSRLDELQAAILKDAMLTRLDRWTSRRRDIAAAYQASIRHSGIRIPQPVSGQGSCWHLFPVFVDPSQKAGFMKFLGDRGIATGEHYPACIFEQDALAGVPFETVDGCQNARQLCRSEVSLPIHPYLTDAEVASVAAACNDWADGAD